MTRTWSKDEVKALESSNFKGAIAGFNSTAIKGTVEVIKGTTSKGKHYRVERDGRKYVAPGEKFSVTTSMDKLLYWAQEAYNETQDQLEEELEEEMDAYWLANPDLG